MQTVKRLYLYLMSGITLDSRFVRVGSQTWSLPEMKPKQTDKVPPALLAVPIAEGDEEADAELDDEGLESVLASWVHDPRYEDFGEEGEIELADVAVRNKYVRPELSDDTRLEIVAGCDSLRDFMLRFWRQLRRSSHRYPVTPSRWPPAIGAQASFP